jgi:hypothetical protein
VTVAPVVLPMGEHTFVGCVPPPVPAVLHWFTVAGDVDALPLMWLTMFTLHVTVPPPPLPEPLHWVTDVVSCVDGLVVVVQVGGACAAP